MPLIKGKEVDAETAVKTGFCPETGKLLSDIEDIPGHIASLWPGLKSPEAEKRIALLKEFDVNRSNPAAPKPTEQ